MKPTLLVLAAGMGSRFGGLKQMEPVGPSGEWILDYSVYDARRAGFAKAVFVIRREMEDDFRALTESKYAAGLEIAYAFQERGDLPVTPPSAEPRQKPWGTGHAVYAARRELEDAPFAVINADDFYGAEAFQSLAAFLQDPSRQKPTPCYALVGYELANTLSEHGSVSRGLCATAESGELLSIEEHTCIQRQPDGAISAVDAEGSPVALNPHNLVSLNCWGFPGGWARELEPLLADFISRHGHEPKSEFYLPAAVDQLIDQGKARAVALPCQSRWLGVTHREDLPLVRQAIAELVASGAYPSPLAT